MGCPANNNAEAEPLAEMKAVTDRLLPGLSVGIFAKCRARFEVAPMTDHLLIVRLGGPAMAAVGIDGRDRSDSRPYGQIDLLPAGTSGIWEVEQHSTTVRFQFSPARIRATAAKMGSNPDMMELLPQHKVRDTQIDHIVAAINYAITDDMPLARSYGENLGTALLARVIAAFSAAKPAKAKSGLSKKQFQYLSDYIEGHIDKQLSSAELALVIGASVPYFRILFRRTMGIPVHQYIIQRRVERAKTLLRQGRTISQAAAEAGFADQSHLARSTRRVIGLLPLEIMRQNRPNR
jgi:AraC family transcriptional regulator